MVLTTVYVTHVKFHPKSYWFMSLCTLFCNHPQTEIVVSSSSVVTALWSDLKSSQKVSSNFY